VTAGRSIARRLCPSGGIFTTSTKTTGRRPLIHRPFFNTLGGPINAGEMLRASFYPLLRRAGLSRIRFHDLRHTAATLMLSRGVHPKIVAERLGHSTPMLTLTVYSHVTPTMQRAAADELDAALSGGSRCAS
jgi:integrase